VTEQDYQTVMPTWPQDPGVYRFVGEDETILYVGKAKNLKKRLMSYFGNRKDRQNKTKALVRNAKYVEYTIVETEQDALLLECTLIKKYQPRYNVQLKDGKSYPYICIKNEPFPRIFLTRRVVRDGSDYFGPYPSKNQAFAIMDLIKNLFPLRTCNFNLSPENIEKSKFKVCLEYHIKNCGGGCEGLETAESYQRKVQEIKNLLKGNFASVKALLREEMQAFAEALEFERAFEHKIKLDALEDYQGKSTVVNPKIKDVDVFSIETDEKMAYVNYLKVVNGVLINTYTLELTPNLDEEKQDLLEFAIPELREKFNSIAPEILVPFEVSIVEKDVEVVVPKIGDKKKLLDLSLKNVTYFKLQKQKQELAKMGKQQSTERILITMKKDLQMNELPRHIECFDNSNIQGTNPVSSCVVFRDTKPSKQEYRHFHVKTVTGPNDFASMEEVVLRRYKRMIAEGKPLPNLIIIDGGKGQLSSALKSLKALGIENQVTVIGIAKKLEEIFFPNDNVPLYLNKRSESLKVIQQARDEAHRFAITFHRQMRSKNFIQTELTKIEGIGEKTADKLLAHFGSAEKVKAALFSELREVVGKAAATKIMDFYKKAEQD
jgi:excinuclease ABC subunit C